MGLPEYHHHRQESAHHSKANHNYPQLSRKFVARRISEGETGRLKEESKCQACGKGYKHVSSSAKHSWEHTPEWNVTSKLLISKHQQVQSLEAASILVSMNEEDDEDANTDANGDNTEDGDAEKAEAADRASSEAIDDSPDSGTSPEAAAEGSTELSVPGPVTPASSTVSSASPIAVSSASNRSADEKCLTPAKDIPILSATSRPIAKTPARNRRRSSTNQHPLATPYAGSSGSSSYGMAGSLDAHLRQASPLPESSLARDLPSAYNSARRRRTSTLVPSSVPRHSSHVDTTLSALDDEDEDEADNADGLQDPQEHESDAPRTPKHSPRPRKVSPKKEDVFGMEF